MRGYLDNDVLPALGDKLPTEITRRDCASRRSGKTLRHQR